MHQDAANRVRSEATRLVPPTVNALGDADRFRALALIAKLGCVVQHENEIFGGGGTIACRLEMAGQNVRFADTVIRERSGRLPWYSPNPGRRAECFVPWRFQSA